MVDTFTQQSVKPTPRRSTNSRPRMEALHKLHHRHQVSTTQDAPTSQRRPEPKCATTRDHVAAAELRFPRRAEEYYAGSHGNNGTRCPKPAYKPNSITWQQTWGLPQQEISGPQVYPSQHRMCAIDTNNIVTISEHRLLCIP